MEGGPVNVEHYIDTRFAAVHRRIDDQRHLTEREQDNSKQSLDYRLQAMDHDRDLIREEVSDCVRTSRGDVLETRIRQLERTVTLLVGGLMLAGLILSLLGALIVKYG